VIRPSEEATPPKSPIPLRPSKDMIDAQPPLTLGTWREEIDEMRTAYGFLLRADQTAGVAEFISHAASALAAGA
jgi:hypothetical protein